MELVLNNISKHFGQRHVLKNINYTFIGPGLYVLFGHSGCGKTTLLNILANLEKPSSGQLIIKNKNRFSKAGIIFQHHYLLGELTAYENVVLPLQINNCEINKEEVNNFFAKLGVENLKHKRIKYCSGGECQRINIIRTLLSKPAFLLADEPTGSIDETNAHFIKETLLDLAKHLLVIIVSHDRTLFANLSATYLKLEKGSLLEYGVED